MSSYSTVYRYITSFLFDELYYFFFNIFKNILNGDKLDEILKRKHIKMTRANHY